MGPTNAYRQLTPAERKLIKEKPRAAHQALGDAMKTLTVAQERFSGNGLVDGEGDAFRHAYWNALMARHLGEADASAFAYAHEAYPPGNGKEIRIGRGMLPTQPRATRMMDEHNNQVGRHLGLSNHAVTDAELIDVVENALKQGRLATKP